MPGIYRQEIYQGHTQHCLKHTRDLHTTGNIPGTFHINGSIPGTYIWPEIFQEPTCDRKHTRYSSYCLKHARDILYCRKHVRDLHTFENILRTPKTTGNTSDLHTTGNIPGTYYCQKQIKALHMIRNRPETYIGPETYQGHIILPETYQGHYILPEAYQESTDDHKHIRDLHMAKNIPTIYIWPEAYQGPPVIGNTRDLLTTGNIPGTYILSEIFLSQFSVFFNIWNISATLFYLLIYFLHSKCFSFKPPR